MSGFCNTSETQTRFPWSPALFLGAIVFALLGLALGIGGGILKNEIAEAIGIAYIMIMYPACAIAGVVCEGLEKKGIF